MRNFIEIIIRSKDRLSDESKEYIKVFNKIHKLLEESNFYIYNVKRKRK